MPRKPKPPAPVPGGQVLDGRVLSAEETRRRKKAGERAERLRTRAGDMDSDCAEAFRLRDWEAVGSPVGEWASYALGPLMKMSAETRREVAGEMARAGCSTREIAAVICVSQSTAARDVKAIRESNDSETGPAGPEQEAPEPLLAAPQDVATPSAPEAAQGGPEPAQDPAGVPAVVTITEQLPGPAPSPPAPSPVPATEVPAEVLARVREEVRAEERAKARKVFDQIKAELAKVTAELAKVTAERDALRRQRSLPPVTAREALAALDPFQGA